MESRFGGWNVGIWLRCCFVISFTTGMGVAQQYFPWGALGSESKMDRILADWYSQELAAVKEPSLWEDVRNYSDVEEYRFLWLRSFHAPITVRLNLRTDGTASLTAKEGNVHGATEPGRLVRTQTKVVSQERVKLFQKRLDSLHFWNIPGPAKDFGGADGSRWIIEAVNHGKYKVADVWSPPPNDPVYLLGAMLVFDFANIRVPRNLIY